MSKKRPANNPQPDATMKEARESVTHALHPLEVMRNVYQQMEITFNDDDDSIFTCLNLENVEVQVICCGAPDDLASVIVALPVRAAPKFRAAAGEFLHRLNYGSKRKFWEIDHNDGEIRMVAYADTMAGPLTEPIFRGLLHFMLMTADKVFPYLTSVLSGRMTPAFAADQASAAIIAMCDDCEKTEEG
jgi:hypothetical protein